MCQAALNGGLCPTGHPNIQKKSGLLTSTDGNDLGTVDSQPATVDVRYLRQPHVVDASGQGPVLIASQGYR